jgi:aminoglycoside 2'-N-acetyltransferase I
VVTVRTLRSEAAPAGLLDDVRRLLDSAFGDFSDDDWAHTLGGWHVVVTDGGRVVSHAAAVPRTIEVDGEPFRAGYVEGVATAPDRRGHGSGTQAMKELGSVIRSRFELGVLSTSRPGFYERLGWERWCGPTYVRHPGGLRRTADEDDGIMVLRFGPSQDVDLSALISCEERPGDDW